MNQYYTIPITNEPNQTMSCTINIDGANRELLFVFRYNLIAGYWWFSVSDNGIIVLDSIPLVTGDYPTADFLEPYRYLGLGTAMLLKTNKSGSTEIPDDTNLESDFMLLWGDTNV